MPFEVICYFDQKSFTLIYFIEKEKSQEEVKELQSKLDTAILSISDEQERAAASLELLEKMKQKMSTMVDQVCLII